MEAEAALTTNALFAGGNNGQTNQIWRYEQVADLTGTGWETAGYNDSAWPSGRALLAFETGAWITGFLNTVLTDPRLANNPPVGHARYFRTHFTWTGSPAGGTLRFNARLDDGALIYVNGVEVFRLRPPTAPITHASVGAPLACGGDADCGDDVFTAYAPSLVEGDNVLAVAVYQNATGSSDIVWGTGLAGIPGVASSITDPTQPSNRVVMALHPTRLSVSAFGSPPPTYQWYFQPEGGGGFNPVANGPGISGATNASLMISNMMMSNAGSYYCTAINPVSTATSRVAVVQFVPDTTGPVIVKASGNGTFDRFIIEYDEFVDSMQATDPFNYEITNFPLPNNPSSVTLGADGRTVTLITTPSPGMLTQNTDYTINISGVSDISTPGNTMTSTQVVVRSWITSTCGGVLFEAFNTGGGNAVSVLTSHPDFPNNPDFRTILPAADIRTATVPGPGDPNNPGFYNSDTRENYGGRLRGLFIASESGPHIFYFASDDNGEFWLSTDSQPVNKVLVARENIWSATKEWTASGGGSVLTDGGKRSAPINLESGKGYYFEALFKEGGGGDNCAVAVQVPSQANPPTNGMGAIPGSMLGVTAVPPGIGGAVTFSQQPASTAVDAPARARFAAVATSSGAPFVCYQWQKAEAGGGGVFTDITGATSPNFTTPRTTVADDNGDMYRVVANAIGGSATSQVATLSVHLDVTRPTVVKVIPTSASSVSVVYSELMDAGSATDPLNYVFSDNLFVNTAVANGTNENRIDLTLVPPGMTIGTLYTLTMSGTISGVGTLADYTGNPINPDPTVVTFRAQTYNGNVDTIPALPTAGRLPLGSLSTRGIMVRLIQVSAAIANDNTVTEQILAGVYPTNATPLPNIAPLPLHFETGMINYNKDGPGTMDGHLVPDAQFPGFGSMSNAVLDNLAMEAVTYVELQPGIYRMVVRSDDGFRLTSALSAEDPGNSFVIGEFNGGRGVADSPTNDFYVTQAGLYPMRLIFEEGNGGAAVEWKVLDTETGAYYGVNSSTIVPAAGFPGGGPSAYLPPCSNKNLTVQKSGSDLVISWQLAGGGNLFQLQQANVLANPPSATVWSNVGPVPKTSGSAKSITVPIATAAKFYRLFRPGPPCTP